MTQCATTEKLPDSMVKINMDAVITEFKTRLAYEKRCFKSMSKHEQREVRSERKVFNQYVEQVQIEHALELPDSQKKWLFTHVGKVSAL